ncbi:uncharacterized protein FTOL_07306 [Fusarium torulosum]|uniref:Uncharacterized protein n=1 Tax=Fusarium torulosum TaxID=33205 RepID=A0AAE8MAV1_9HYPO|nr:uncharacterized protein FTOL_07306 [Fusarium torulosum]
MPSQTPLNKEENEIQRQQGSSTSTDDVALPSEDDLTLREHSSTSTLDCCTPGDPESTEADDCSLEPAANSPQGDSYRYDPNLLGERITAPRGMLDASFMPIILKFQRRLKVLERFPKQGLRQPTTPEQRNPGAFLTSFLKKSRRQPQLENPSEYLASQREACKRMLKEKIEEAIEESSKGWC